MKPSDFFRKALLSAIKRKGITQKKLADDLEINPILLNNFLKGRVNFSEDRMVKISEYLGIETIDMLNLGYKLLAGSEPTPPELSSIISSKEVSEKLQTLNQDDLKLVDELITRLKGKD